MASTTGPRRGTSRRGSPHSTKASKNTEERNQSGARGGGQAVDAADELGDLRLQPLVAAMKHATLAELSLNQGQFMPPRGIVDLVRLIDIGGGEREHERARIYALLDDRQQ